MWLVLALAVNKWLLFNDHEITFITNRFFDDGNLNVHSVQFIFTFAQAIFEAKISRSYNRNLVALLTYAVFVISLSKIGFFGDEPKNNLRQSVLKMKDFVFFSSPLIVISKLRCFALSNPSYFLLKNFSLDRDSNTGQLRCSGALGR